MREENRVNRNSKLVRYLLWGVVCVALIVFLAVRLWPRPELEIISLDVETKVQYINFLGWQYDIFAIVGVRNSGNEEGNPHFYLSIPERDYTKSIWGRGDLKPNETTLIREKLVLSEGSYTLEVLDQDRNPTRFRKSFEVKKPPPPEFTIKRFDVTGEQSTVTIEITLKNVSSAVATFSLFLNFMHNGKHCSPTSMGPGSFSFYLAPGEEETEVVSYSVSSKGHHTVSLYGMSIQSVNSRGRTTAYWTVEFEEIIREFETED